MKKNQVGQSAISLRVDLVDVIFFVNFDISELKTEIQIHFGVAKGGLVDLHELLIHEGVVLGREDIQQALGRLAPLQLYRLYGVLAHFALLLLS